MALLAAGIFSVVSINPTAVLAESAETESTTGEALAVPAGEAFVVDGDGADGEMSVSDDGTPIKKTAKPLRWEWLLKIPILSPLWD